MTSDGSGSGDLEKSLARTSDKYDALPYESIPTTLSHPARTAAIARLFGLTPPPVERARVLELGCATGGNIIPFAAFHPNARVVGIDIGKRQVEIGQARIAALGLANVELRHASITDLPQDLGEFDYIVCHGVYSWVPAEVREAILAACGRLLSEHGVAFVSYNVLPGWRMFQPLRDALRAIIPPGQDEAARARSARQFLDYAAAMTPSGNAYASLLRQAPARLGDLADSYLFHEYLEEVNEPCLLSDFTAAAGQHRLGYLGDCNLGSMFPENHGREFAGQLYRSSRGDIVSIEQMLDILTGRPFRMSLLVRSGAFFRIDRAITPERLEGLHFLPSEELRLERHGDGARVLGQDGLAVDYEDPQEIAILEAMFAAAPASLSFEAFAGQFADGEARERAVACLFRFVTGGVIVAASEAMPAAPAGERPLATALARIDAAAGEEVTATRRHTGADINSLDRLLLPLMDGTRDIGELAAALSAAAREGRIGIRGRDGGEPDAGELPAIASAMTVHALDRIAAAGLLEA